MAVHEHGGDVVEPEHGGDVVEPEHLLVGLTVSAPGSLLRCIRAGAVIDTVTKEIRSSMKPAIRRPLSDEIFFAPSLQTVLFQAVREADILGGAEVRAEHLLLALLQNEQSTATNLLQAFGVTRERLAASLT
jgi:ATP-dependent Clp protease ATP-binding subunit ClpA